MPGADEASTKVEMSDAAEVVSDLAAEYEACESADYLRWGAGGGGASDGPGSMQVDSMLEGMRI